MDLMPLQDSIVQLVLVVLSIIITKYLVPYLKEKYTAEKVSNTYDHVIKAVQAAEKAFEDYTGVGDQKKQYVLNYLKSKNINLSEEDVDVFIDSAIKLLDVLQAEIKKDTK